MNGFASISGNEALKCLWAWSGIASVKLSPSASSRHRSASRRSGRAPDLVGQVQMIYLRADRK